MHAVLTCTAAWLSARRQQRLRSPAVPPRQRRQQRAAALVIPRVGVCLPAQQALHAVGVPALCWQQTGEARRGSHMGA